MEITEGHNITFNFYLLSPEAISSGIHMTGEHEGNYFHWIVEILPRLFLCEQLLKGKHIPILISEGLHANLIALLDIIRAPERPVLQLQKNSTYFVENLIYPSDVARLFDTYDRAPGDDTIYIPVALLKGMAAKIKRSLVDIDNFDNHKKRLFVRRNSSYRMLLNQSAIESMLAERGFHVIDPETMTIEEQICIFSKAEVVIGPSGAGMANILWCKPETRILILHSDHPYKKYPYWDALARASGSKIAYLAGARAFNVTDIFEAHDDFSISPSDLDKLLDVEGARI
jgi:capsular polysaccharide biosynthesis protein